MQERDIKKTYKRSGSYGRSNHSEGRSRKRKKIRAFTMLFVMGFFAVTGILYLGRSIRYQEIFLPDTTINGINVSELNIEQARDVIDSYVAQYRLIIEERDGTEEIYGSRINLRAECGEKLEKILGEQNPFAWGIRSLIKKDYKIEIMASYDEEKLSAAVDSLIDDHSEAVKKPVDAYLTYVKGSGLQIMPEVRGNELIPELLLAAVSNAVRNLEKRISLEELGIYREPQILENDPVLNSRKERLEPYALVTVNYHFGSQTEVLDGNMICEWLGDDGNGNVTIDEEKAAEYVKGLAEKYNTAYRVKKFKTSYGSTVTIKSGHYGWMINQKAETEALVNLIYSCESQEREPIYSQTAASHDGPDYGDTYAELNLTAQHMFFYKNGKLLVESDFVSGNEAKGWSTPPGAFSLTYKQKNAVLKGKNYATPVTYWMPFNGNIGMHDGYWRSSFGGSIYEKNGSHGCVNLPPSVAKTVFVNIEAGMPVLVYNLEGTEKNSSVETEKKADKNITRSVPETKESASSVQPSKEAVVPVSEPEISAAQPLPEQESSAVETSAPE